MAKSFYEVEVLPTSGVIATQMLNGVETLVVRGETKQEVKAKVINIYRGVFASDRTAWDRAKRNGVSIRAA